MPRPKTEKPKTLRTNTAFWIMVNINDKKNDPLEGKIEWMKKLDRVQRQVLPHVKFVGDPEVEFEIEYGDPELGPIDHKTHVHSLIACHHEPLEKLDISIPHMRTGFQEGLDRKGIKLLIKRVYNIQSM